MRTSFAKLISHVDKLILARIIRAAQKVNSNINHFFADLRETYLIQLHPSETLHCYLWIVTYIENLYLQSINDMAEIVP